MRTTPGRRDFRGLADLLAAGPPDLAALAASGDRYGLEYGQPAWLPDIVARLSLTSW